jgi:hypothetical protein
MPKEKVSKISQCNVNDSESEEEIESQECEIPLTRDQVVALMGFDEDNLEEYFSDRSSSFEDSDLEGDGQDTVISCEKLMSKKFLTSIRDGKRKKVYARTHDWPTSEIEHLRDALAQTSTVKVLKVACENDAFAALGEILKDTTIEEMTLERCYGGDEGDSSSEEENEEKEEHVPEFTPNANYFFDVLAENSSIKELSLRQRLIHDKDIQMLVGALHTNTVLQKITIEWPYDYNYEPIVTQTLVEKLLELGWNFSLDSEYGIAELCK